MKYRVLMIAGLTLAAGIASAADWAQWRGPDRTSVSKETGVVQSFPEGGPKLLWTFDQAGLGYSGPAIVGNRLYSCGADEHRDKEFVFALDTDAGKEVWRTPLKLMHPDPNFKSDQWGGGPRCTPTVVGDHLYVLGAQGDLACLETKTGKLVWQKNLIGDFGGKVMQIWGYSESPLIDGDRLICCPGGENGSVAALNKADGSVVWRSKDLTDNASYASMVIANLGGIKQYIVKTEKNTAGIAAADGKLLWKDSLGTNDIATIPTPIVSGDTVFTTCGYRSRGGTCGLIQVTAEGETLKPTVVWKDSNLFNHHGGVVLVNGHLYGHSDGDRRNNQKAGWVCIDHKTGKEVWVSDKLDKGSVVAVGDRLYCWGERSDTLVLIDASPEGWTERGRFTMPKKSPKKARMGMFWTHPVVANGKLYVRDQDLLFCFDVSADRKVN